MIERFVEVPGSRLYALDEGPKDGTPIVLLHAAIADLRAWDSLVPFLADVGRRVIRYDLRGFGRSVTEAVEFSNRADAIAVLDAFDVERVFLVGNSRGGQIAFDTAIEYPDRVSGVVGVAAGLGGFQGQPTPEEEALFEEGDRLESSEPLDADAIADFDVRLWVDGLGQPPTRVPSAIREAVREMDRPQFLPDHVDGRPIVLQPPANDRIDDLRCPVLAIAGALDVAGVSQAALHLQDSAPNARAIILADVAHMIGMEQPESLARLILDFVRGVEDA